FRKSVWFAGALGFPGVGISKGAASGQPASWGVMSASARLSTALAPAMPPPADTPPPPMPVSRRAPPNLGQALQEAVTLQQRGRLREAEKIYTRVLKAL